MKASAVRTGTDKKAAAEKAPLAPAKKARKKASTVEHVNVTVPPELVARARELASIAGRPLSWVFSEALEHYVHIVGLAELLAELDAEYGPVPPDAAADAQWDAVIDQASPSRPKR